MPEQPPLEFEFPALLARRLLLRFRRLLFALELLGLSQPSGAVVVVLRLVLAATLTFSTITALVVEDDVSRFVMVVDSALEVVVDANMAATDDARALFDGVAEEEDDRISAARGLVLGVGISARAVDMTAIFPSASSASTFNVVDDAVVVVVGVKRQFRLQWTDI